MTYLPPDTPQPAEPRQPRAQGNGFVSSKQFGAASVIDGLRQQGALKLVFPRSTGGLQVVSVNTAGGMTGGDRFSLTAHAGEGTRLSLTTQAAERAYRARSGEIAEARTMLSAGPGAELHWLPQEMILFEGSALRRRLKIDLAPGARLLMAEPLVFGRTAMGETLRSVQFRDRIEICRSGRPLYLDAMRLSGDAAAHLAGPATGDGARAMASVVYSAPDAESRLCAVRPLLPRTGGASLLSSDLLVIRLLGRDSFTLRKSLVPLLDLLSGQTLPASWRL